MRVLLKPLLIIAVALICSCGAHNNSPKSGDVASASLADVQAAINGANDGDTLNVPAGRATWRSQLVITKSISLIGAGAGKTIITAGFTNYTNSDYLLCYYPATATSSTFFRVSGFTIDGGAQLEGLQLRHSFTTPTQFRIDHCTFGHFKRDPTMNVRVIDIDGLIYGVIDSNTFTLDQYTGNYQVISSYGDMNGDVGQWQWENNSYSFGSANNVYIEDNVFNICNVIGTTGAGGRYVVRHNTINFTHPELIWTLYLLDLHGNMTNDPTTYGNRSSFGCEVYENTINLAGRECLFNDLRGGKSLIYNNYVVNCTDCIANVGEEYADYGNPPAVSPVTGQPQHVSDTYIFSNYANGAVEYLASLPGVSQLFDYSNPSLPTGALHAAHGVPSESWGVVPRNDVHFWRHVATFDGSTGIGVGPIASRPSSCTLQGAGWWATDQSILYRWNATTGVWEQLFTPYTYPHPLRTSTSD